MEPCTSLLTHSLGEAVLRVADFDGSPVAGSYQTDEAQQVGECPGHVGGIVTAGKTSSSDLTMEKKWLTNEKP